MIYENGISLSRVQLIVMAHETLWLLGLEMYHVLY